MDFDLIIFDCDGVLVDSEPLANKKLQMALNDAGLNLSLEEVIRHFVGLSMKTVVTKAEQMLGKTLPGDFLQNLQEQTFEVFRSQLKAVEGIRHVLDVLKQKNQAICVASSGDFTKMNLTLGLTELHQYFGKNIFSSYQVKRGKPYPDLYLFAADQMNVDPARCLVVEDSVPGVQGAVAAGMEVLAYSVRGECKKLAVAGGIVINDVQEILKYLE